LPEIEQQDPAASFQCTSEALESLCPAGRKVKKSILHSLTYFHDFYCATFFIQNQLSVSFDSRFTFHRQPPLFSIRRVALTMV
jgi:hypothetical protein